MCRQGKGKQSSAKWLTLYRKKNIYLSIYLSFLRHKRSYFRHGTIQECNENGLLENKRELLEIKKQDRLFNKLNTRVKGKTEKMSQRAKTQN